MKVELVLNDRNIECLKRELGEGRVEVFGKADDGFYRVVFYVNNDFDVLKVLHAGVSSGIELMKQSW